MNSTPPTTENLYITTGAINRRHLTRIVKEHHYAVVCQVDIDRGRWKLAYTVGLGQFLLPELYLRLPPESPLVGTEFELIRTIVAHHRDSEITVGDLIEVPDLSRHTVHEFGAVPVTIPHPLPGITAVFPNGPSWTVEIFTSDCRCHLCRAHPAMP